MIYVNEENLEFHLSNGQISYIFRVMESTDIMEQLYFGEAVDVYPTYDFLVEREVKPGNNLLEGSGTTSLEQIKQEFPVYGTTDFRYSAVEVEYPTGDSISHFAFQKYEIKQGKEKVKGLPTTTGNPEEVEVLTVFLKDRYSGLVLELSYGIYRNFPVITRQSKITNYDEQSMRLERFLSMNLDMPNEDYEWLHLSGAWAREMQLSRDKIITGVQHVSSTRGATGHMHNPMIAVCAPETTEFSGKVYGFNLIYSGNFLAQIELDTYDIARIQLGINPFQFSWELAPKESFLSPEAVMVFSSDGLNKMSQSFHDFYREHLIAKQWQIEARPVLINNWEATYFDFNEEKILEIVEKASSLDIDLFVLDDGWFGTRDTDNGSLGNWVEDKRKLPEGIAGLAKKITALGMKFGLWFEPEMISKDTPLYEKHSDWLIGNPAKNISHGRNQYVLDFSRPEVVEAIFEQMAVVLRDAPISYVKWDMNRYISEAYSNQLPAQRQGEVFHRYILGVYELYEKLREAFPNLLIESCAGGGGRFDAGLLYYAPQAWLSDDTDAIERLKIQYGASLGYPLSAIGSHVSVVPNHQVGRLTSLETRGNVAMFGTFGYELDITQYDEADSDKIRKQVEQFKAHQSLIHKGDFYRLKSPFESNEIAWMVVSKDRKEALVGWYQVLSRPNPSYQRLLLQGLASNCTYRIDGSDQVRKGRDLMNIGLLLADNQLKKIGEQKQTIEKADFSSLLFYLQEVKED